MGSNNKRKTTEEFKNEIEKLCPGEYKILNEYHNCKTHIKFEHNCGNIFEMSPDHFLRGYRCPKCSYARLGRERRHTTEEVRETLDKLNFDLLSEYTFSNEKIMVKNRECNHIYSVKYRYIITEYTGCPTCNQSKGEKKIEKYLEENGYAFSKQYRTKDCKDKRELPFDFRVVLNNKIIFIEYNGIQHYSEDFRKGCNKKYKDTLEEIQRRDKIKLDYCSSRNIPLLIIKYTDFNNIEQILNDYFLGFND